MPREPNAAQALYPHLPSKVPELPERRRPSSNSVSAALYPNLPQPPPPAWIALNRATVWRQLLEYERKYKSKGR
jgi:hypothetical protein